MLGGRYNSFSSEKTHFGENCSLSGKIGRAQPKLVKKIWKLTVAEAMEVRSRHPQNFDLPQYKASSYEDTHTNIKPWDFTLGVA